MISPLMPFGASGHPLRKFSMQLTFLCSSNFFNKKEIEERRSYYEG
jgi:hypothetical protein